MATSSPASSEWYGPFATTDLPDVMAKFLAFCRTVPEVVEAMSRAPERVLVRAGLGHLGAGIVADAIVFRASHEPVDLFDVEGVSCDRRPF